MSSFTIPPYYHPTTIVFIDDNDLFLQALDLRVPADTACAPFHDPAEALARINRRLELRSIPDRFPVPASAWSLWPESVVRLDAPLITEEINNLQRFRRVSVVVADLGIPAMDGLELCDRIADGTTKKVLMTGASDQRRAVEAFNAGVIDRFVEKNQHNTLDLVVSHIIDLQQEYFFHQQRLIQESLSLTAPPMLEDPAIITHFATLRRKHRLVEHYVTGEPPGFVCITAKGSLFRILILSDDEVAQQARFATSHGAPSDVVRSLESRSRIGLFYERPEGYSDDPATWHDLMHEPTPVKGRQIWWTAVVSKPPMDVEFVGGDFAFNAYLDEIDAKI